MAGTIDAVSAFAMSRLLALALLGALASWSARADTPVNGAALFTTHCATCHGSSPLTTNRRKIFNGRNARAVIDAAIAANVGGMGALRRHLPVGGSELADLASFLGNTPTSLNFLATVVGTTAAAQTVTVYASLKGGNAISGLSVAVAGDFARSGGSCASSVATGLNCTVLVDFTPTATGARSGSLSISHSNSLTPITIALAGTGSAAPAPIASLTPSSLTLAATAIGDTSAAQNATLSNTGNAPLSIITINIDNGADFIVAGGTCSAGASLAAGSSCTVSLAFRPSPGALGRRSGTLSIAHNAVDSPSSASLSGDATAALAPVASLTAALAFGSVNVGAASLPQTAVLSNTGTAPLAIGTLVTGSTEFVIVGGSCAAGGSLAAGANCSVVIGFTPSVAGARSANLVITHNAGPGRSSASLSGTGVALSPVIGVSPTTLSFSQAVGTTSTQQTVTVSNSGSAPLALAALSLGGAQAAEFQIGSGTTCAAGANVAAGASCTLKLAFAPAATGVRSASLSITHNAAGSPSAVALNGIATQGPQPAISLNASALSFAAQTLGSTSASQSVAVSNTGSATLNLSALTLTGTAAGDFTRGGTCSPTSALAPGANCSISYLFTPGAVGTRSATLTIASDAANGSAVLSLSGTGVAAATPGVRLTPAALAFGNQTTGVASAARSVVLSNTGTAPLAIGTLVTGSTEFVIVGGSCAAGGSLAAGANCSVVIGFTPSVAGARSANLVITHNAGPGRSSASLSGTGVALSPVIGVSPTTLSFSQAVGTTSTQQTVTVSNSGSAPLALAALSLGGAQAAEFQIGSGTTCAAGANVAAGASCTLKLAFAPTGTGVRSASLSITHNASGSPSAVALNGIGTPGPQPAISLNASALSFAAQTLGSTSASQSVAVSNTGSATLNLSALTLTGTAAGDFTRGGTCSPTSALAPGANCSISYLFTPGAVGTRSATLTIASDAANGSAVLSLSGTGVAAATPGVRLTPAALAFGNQTTGVASAARSVVLSNIGSGLLSIAGISATAGFGVSHDCGASLVAAATCTMWVTFTPVLDGAAVGSVSVASSAAGSPHAVSLSGTGVAASPVLAWVPAITTLEFGDLSVGAPPSARSLTLFNQGPGAVTLQQFALAGLQAADFSRAGVGSCTVGAVLAQGATCTVALEFQPGAVGVRNATLHVASSGSNPADIALSGTGIAMARPALDVVPAALSFSVPAGVLNVDTQTLTVHNAGSAVLSVSGLRIASGSFTLATAAVGGCPAVPFDLLPGQSCSVAVGWSNPAPGAESGTLEIDTSAAATPLQVAIEAERGAAPEVPLQISNVGAGGCSIASGESLADPTLWLLVLLAAGVLGRRLAGGAPPPPPESAQRRPAD